MFYVQANNIHNEEETILVTEDIEEVDRIASNFFLRILMLGSLQ